MKFPLKIKDSTFIVLEKYRILGCNIGNIANLENIGSLDTLK
jgi:hypothetical protein